MYKLYAFFDLDCVDSEMIGKFISILPEDRMTRALHYRREIDRKVSVLAYLLLFYALNKEYGLSFPTFAYADKGKPYLQDYPDIHFNFSHCPRGCVCAISDDPIGVDIQDVRSFSWDIAQRCCSNAEIRLLEQSSDPATCFTRMWAMKESYLKMTGEGITQKMSAVDTTGAYSTIHTTFMNNCYIAVSSAHFFREESK